MRETFDYLTKHTLYIAAAFNIARTVFFILMIFLEPEPNNSVEANTSIAAIEAKKNEIQRADCYAQTDNGNEVMV